METSTISAEAWIAAGTWATVGVLLGTLVYVIRQVGEARELRREQFRPWVTVGFHFRSIYAFIAIKNAGNTVARNVQIEFEPELVSTLSNPGFDQIAVLNDPIPNLAPGEQHIALFDCVPDRLKSDLPKQHRVRVTYQDHRGGQLGPDEFALDVGILYGGTLPDKGMHDLVEEVRKIREKLP